MKVTKHANRRLKERSLLRRERLYRVLDVIGFLPKHFSDKLTRYGKFSDDSEPKLAWYKDDCGVNTFLFQESFNEMLSEFMAKHTNINKIISKLKSNSKGIKIFFATIIPSYAPATNAGYKSLNDKIKSIVEANSDIYLLDLNKYSESANHAAYNRTHPTALGYHKIANEIASYISYIIRHNLDDFESVQFIGTDQ